MSLSTMTSSSMRAFETWRLARELYVSSRLDVAKDGPKVSQLCIELADTFIQQSLDAGLISFEDISSTPGESADTVPKVD